MNEPLSKPVDLALLRESLSERHGRDLWRSLEELAGSAEFDELIAREFPRQAAILEREPDAPGGVDRRRFLQVAGASMALGGLTACTRQPLEKIVPYVRQPEEIVPGRPLYFATAMPVAGVAQPVLVESHMGRPTKVDGHPEHPAGTGATDLFAQASVLEMYDPERSRVVRELRRPRTWAAFLRETRTAITALEAMGSVRLRVLTGTVTSPTLRHTLQRVLTRFPDAAWHSYEAAGTESVRAGAHRAFGRDVETLYDFGRARVVLSLDADFLASGRGHLRHARDFMALRRVRSGSTSMNRLYAVESTPTPTGTLADHRLPLRPSELAAFAAALAAELGLPGAERPAEGARGPSAEWISAVARDLASERGGGLVIAGEQAPAEVHALAHAINAALGNVGSTVRYVEPLDGASDSIGGPTSAEPAEEPGSLGELVNAMQAGAVDVLLILGGNPVYNAPADLEFATAMLQVPHRIRFGLFDDETSALCQWHLPEAHYLESWGDLRAFDGTVSLQQPIIEPLHGGRTASELLAHLIDDTERPAKELLEERWRDQTPADAAFEKFWRRCLHDGYVAGTASPAASPTLRAGVVAEATAAIAASAPGPEGSIELVLRPDPTVGDGRWANNGWLQECPKPFTKLTWDNAVLISPALAVRLGVGSEDVVEVTSGGRTIEGPAWITPGHPDGAATLHLGYGRTAAGNVGNGAGFDAYRLRTSAHPWSAAAEIRPTGRRYPLASTQLHANLELETREAAKRHLIRHGTIDRFRREPDFAQHMGHPAGESLYPPFVYEGYAWGLAVDLAACTGCNACVVACQAENNIPVVGKDQVSRGREMHWIRIDRYYEGELGDPAIHHQPVMCMHCEQAPCEVVCPVAATTHSNEGLNDMIYNRCVGTRYCSNNCPYKVRRFNFLLYNDLEEPLLAMQRNPDVTVRSRGVMEKCTYCVQRINHARIQARVEERKIADGEIVTACQQACPTGAIVFGDVNDPESAVSRWKAEPQNYGILEDLNTRPRTTYLAKLTNPSSELGGGRAGGDHEPAGGHQG
jgi:MoCo/4Fe-4S cofactor protein with predicted Tat translocation signal